MKNKEITKEVFSLWVKRISMVEGLARAFIGVVAGGSMWIIMSAGCLRSPYDIYAFSTYLFFLVVIGVAIILLRNKYIKAAEKDETLDQDLKEVIIKKLKFKE